MSEHVEACVKREKRSREHTEIWNIFEMKNSLGLTADWRQLKKGFWTWIHMDRKIKFPREKKIYHRDN